MEYSNFKNGDYKIDNYSRTVFAAKTLPYMTYVPTHEEAIIYADSIPSSGGITMCSFKEFLSLNPVFVGEHKRA